MKQLQWFYHRRLCLQANALVLTKEEYVTEGERDRLAEYVLKWATHAS